VVEVDPEEQEVAAQQRAEQGACGIPRVKSPGHATEIIGARAQVMEEERKQRAR